MAGVGEGAVPTILGGVAKGSEPAGWSVLKFQVCALFENVMLTLIRNIIKIRPPEIEIFSRSSRSALDS